MNEMLKRIYEVLNSVLKNKVTYGKREHIAINNNNEYIIYQVISNRGVLYCDDKIRLRVVTIQINLITKNKNLELENRLEDFLDANGFSFQMVSEYQNDDFSINRVYEIKMEVIKK